MEKILAILSNFGLGTLISDPDKLATETRQYAVISRIYTRVIRKKKTKNKKKKKTKKQTVCCNFKNLHKSTKNDLKEANCLEYVSKHIRFEYSEHSY